MDNSYNNSYYQGNNYNSHYWNKSMFKFMCGISIVFGLIIHAFLFYGITSVFLLKKNMGGISSFANMNNFYSDYFSLVIVFISYSFVKSIIFSYKLWNFISYKDDSEIINNKWCLLLLSLSLGGVLIPIMIMRYLPNVQGTGTISSKMFIAKNFGPTWLISSIFTMFLLLVITITNGGFSSLTQNSINGLLIVNGLLVVSFLFSLITVILFHDKNIENELCENKTLKGKIANLISYVLLFSVILQLITKIIHTIFQIFTAVAQTLESRNILQFVFNLFINAIWICACIYLIQIIKHTISVLWSAQKNNGDVLFGRINTAAARRYEERLFRRSRNFK